MTLAPPAPPSLASDPELRPELELELEPAENPLRFAFSNERPGIAHELLSKSHLEALIGAVGHTWETAHLAFWSEERVGIIQAAGEGDGLVRLEFVREGRCLVVGRGPRSEDPPVELRLANRNRIASRPGELHDAGTTTLFVWRYLTVGEYPPGCTLLEPVGLAAEIARGDRV